MSVLFIKDFGNWVRSDLFGGKGDVRVADLLGQNAAPPFEAVLGCELAAGGRVGIHRQEQLDEIVVCVGGKGVVTVGKDPPIDFVPGAMAYVKLGSTLQIENGSTDETLRYLIIKAKAQPPDPPPNQNTKP